MDYIKVIDLGHVIEVYEMERIPVNPHDYERKDEYSISNDFNEDRTKEANRHYYEDIKENIKHRENRKAERRSQTIRDARNRCRRLALMNFSEKDTFMTLTFAENIQDITYADNEFKKFMKRFNYKYKRKSKFLAVREFQKRGAIHYHILLDWQLPAALKKEELRSLERELGTNIWGHGFVNLRSLRGQKKQDNPVDNVGAYLVKYMTKNLYESKFNHTKLYLCSRNLKRPAIFVQEDALNILQNNNLLKMIPIFTNKYYSEYIGKVVYSEYNTMRES